MREWSAELAVDGVVKCGYPGIVVVQGEARACDEFVRRLRGLGWSAMSVRLAEDDEAEVYEDFVLNGSDKFSASASRGLRRGWSEIGEDGGDERAGDSDEGCGSGPVHGRGASAERVTIVTRTTALHWF